MQTRQYSLNDSPVLVYVELPGKQAARSHYFVIIRHGQRLRRWLMGAEINVSQIALLGGRKAKIGFVVQYHLFIQLVAACGISEDGTAHSLVLTYTPYGLQRQAAPIGSPGIGQGALFEAIYERELDGYQAPADDVEQPRLSAMPYKEVVILDTYRKVRRGMY